MKRPYDRQTRARAYALEIAPAVQAARAAGAGTSYGALAIALNNLGIPTMSGKRWTASATGGLLKRLMTRPAIETVEDAGRRAPRGPVAGRG